MVKVNFCKFSHSKVFIILFCLLVAFKPAFVHKLFHITLFTAIFKNKSNLKLNAESGISEHFASCWIKIEQK